MMTNINAEFITYDKETETGYIFFAEPKKFEFYTETLPESEQIILDLGKEVPIVGIELDGAAAKKISELPIEQRCFLKETDGQGHSYYSFKLEDKPVRQTVTYERIVDVKFLFADDDCLDFIGVEVYSDNPNYIFNQSSKNDKSKGMFKKILNRFAK
ncbi:DUF2283 domain-containing protein [Anaerobacillus sp. CMMVII]|uniref:DUF2283 domain-containing protein n=1 Tax=Anaerobacillus sp. CMMVII TaxID=2755588 RepID=UPI0021B70FA9|nr:DUF2283 domain-containing protein [Anaerobacillus sp. CMMVII]MCT8139927.1 DUF2283 domain-containing protein [Anaerobacillus sp. CMMVII]